MTTTSILDQILEHYGEEEFLIADGYDRAVIGLDEPSMRLIYSVKKCIKILMKNMSEEDALEFFSFNVSGSHVGTQTPIWCQDNF